MAVKPHSMQCAASPNRSSPGHEDRRHIKLKPAQGGNSVRLAPLLLLAGGSCPLDFPAQPAPRIAACQAFRQHDSR